MLSLTPEKLVVFVPKFALEGTISVSQIAAELSGVISYDDATLCLSILRPTSDQSECLLSLRVFQQITVLLQVVETISGHRQLDMQLDYNNISATIITISNLGSDNMLISSSSKLAISVSEEEGKAAATDFLPFRNDSEDVDVVDAEGDVRAQQSPSSAKRQKLTSSANSESSYSGGKKGFVSLYKNRNISPPLKIAPLRKSKKKI